MGALGKMSSMKEQLVYLIINHIFEIFVKITKQMSFFLYDSFFPLSINGKYNSLKT